MPPPTSLTATFDPPPIAQVMVGTPPTASIPAVSAVDQANRTASRPWAIWFNALYRRFFTLQCSLRIVTKDTSIALSDCTLVAQIQAAATFLLPDPTQIQGQFFFFKNSATSGASVTFSATNAALIDNAAASNVVLSPGQVTILESDGTNWISLLKPAASGTAGPGGATAPTTPIGTTPPPPNPPPTGPSTVTALPASGEPGQQVLFNGTLYQWVGSAQYPGIPGFWEPVVTTPPALQDTHANRLAHFPASSYPDGTTFFETDRTIIYIVQASVWTYYSGAMADVLANIPSDLGSADAGFPFQATDFRHLYRWSGAVWAFDPNDMGSGQLVFAGPGFFLSTGLWGLCDGSTYTVAQSNGTTSPVTTSVITNTYIRR